MNKLLIMTVAVSFSHLQAGEIVFSKNQVFSPRHLGELQVVHRGDEGFVIKKDGQEYKVRPENMENDLREIDQKTLKERSKNGYVRIRQISNGQYGLTMEQRLHGGGYFAGMIAAGVTQAVCWGVIFAAASRVTSPDSDRGHLYNTNGYVANEILSQNVLAPGSSYVTHRLLANGQQGRCEEVIRSIPNAGLTQQINAISGAVGAFFAAIPWLP